MTADAGRTTAEAEIRALIEAQAEAIRAKDVERERLELRPGRPVVRCGGPAAEQGIGRRQQAAGGMVRFVSRHDRLRASRPRHHRGDDVAFCHGLKRVRATTAGGQRLDMWWHATICYRRIDGAWQVTQHASVPFDEASGRASLDLDP